MDSTFDTGFWITISGIVVTFLGSIMIYSLKSKCAKCNLCCGLIKIERDIQNEIAEEKMEIENGQKYII